MGTLWTKIKGSTGGNNKEGGKDGVSRGGSIRGSKKSNKGANSKGQKKKDAGVGEEGATADVKDVVIAEKSSEEAKKEASEVGGATAKEDKDDSDKEDNAKEAKAEIKAEVVKGEVKEEIKEKVADPKLIVVFGATGGQGGSLLRALEADPSFKVRAITRNADSAKAKALAEKGIEVVSADQDQPETLVKALAGAYGVFAVTNYWEHMDIEREIKQGKNIADACKANDVQHVVFSSLDNVEEAIGQKCAHFDTKPVIEAYMKELGLPVTTVLYSLYCENLFTMLKPKKGDDGVYTLLIPMEGKPLHFVPVEETGECLHQVFRNKDTFIGRALGLSSDRAPIAEYAESLTRCLDGPKFKATEMTAKQYAELTFPGAAELAAMFAFYQSPKFERDLNLTRSLHPSIPTFEGWVKKNKERIIASLE